MFPQSVDDEHDLAFELAIAQRGNGRVQLPPADFHADLWPEPLLSNEVGQSCQILAEGLCPGSIDEEAVDASTRTAPEISECDPGRLTAGSTIQDDQAPQELANGVNAREKSRLRLP